MSGMATYEVVLEITANESMNDDELDATAEAVLEGVLANAGSIAVGPVVSVDYDRDAIEILSTVSGEGEEEVHEKMSRITRAMLDAANAFEHQGSTAKKLEPALA